MSAFTYTAPTISLEERQAEREALSDSERMQLEYDLYGPTDEKRLDDVNINLAVESFQESVESILKKEEYLRAKAAVPELVEQESPAIALLKATNWQAADAAKRLVDYWKLRVRVFGEERAFLPMSVDGAIRDDLEHLRKAFVFQLDYDKTGRAVVFFDRVRCIPEVAPRESFPRCLFFVLQCLVKQKSLWDLGFVVIVNMRVSFECHIIMLSRHQLTFLFSLAAD